MMGIIEKSKREEMLKKRTENNVQKKTSIDKYKRDDVNIGRVEKGYHNEYRDKE